jgi:hypothetical protein
MVNNTQVRAVQIRVPGSTTRVGFRTPLAFLPLRGGGVWNRGRTSPTVQISVPRSTAMKTIPDPPHLSTFKRRGGGSGIPYAAFRRPRSRRSDQRRLCSPALLNCPMLSQCGPSSYHFILTSAFPLLPCVIHSPLLFGPCGLTFFSPPTRSLPRVSFLHTSTSHPKASPLHPVFLPPRASPTPSLLSYTMSSTLASMPVPQAIQLFQVAAREVFPIPRS